jgi:hypothetical protein
MREIILVGIAMTVILAGVVAWASSRHPAVVTSPFDPFLLQETQRICPLRSGSTRICGQITQHR